jgi:hypothetical protein
MRPRFCNVRVPCPEIPALVLGLERQLPTPSPVLRVLHLPVNAPLFTPHAVALDSTSHNPIVFGRASVPHACLCHYFLLGERRTPPRLPERRLPLLPGFLKMRLLNGIIGHCCYDKSGNGQYPYQTNVTTHLIGLTLQAVVPLP